MFDWFTKKDKPVVKKREVVGTQITKVPVVKTPAPNVPVTKPKVLTTSKLRLVVDQHEDDEDVDEMEEEVVEVQTFN